MLKKVNIEILFELFSLMVKITIDHFRYSFFSFNTMAILKIIELRDNID